jgi:solute carrier family 25 phosphate transporter 23/24/25/41
MHNGIRSLWRGNLTNCVRVFPYAAIQFASYDRYKSWVIDWCDYQGRSFGHLERLLAGGLAGGTAATLTYPLDVMRLVQAVVAEAKTPTSAMQYIYSNGGLSAFYKGWVPTVMSLGPYIGINFATFDYLKQTFLPQGNKGGSSITVLFLGAGAGLFAQSVCYPLDTIRRVMQIPGSTYKGMYDCCYTIIQKDGIVGMYRGMFPNAIKIVPNNGIRFWVYTYLTTYLNIPKKGGGGD